MAEGGPTELEKQLEIQKNEITEYIKTPLRKGDKWYLIDSKWFKQWKKYVGYETWDMGMAGDPSGNPGPIDNSPLFKTGDTLKDSLIDELDYMLVPQEAWNKMVDWYGLAEGQSAIERKVIDQGLYTKQPKVEVYDMEFKLCQNSDQDTFVVFSFSRAATIDDIEKAMRKLFEIQEDKEVRLWNKYMSNTYEHLNKPENTVQDAGLYQGQVIVIESKNEDGSWPRQQKSGVAHSSTTSTASNGSNDNQVSSYGAPSSASRGGYANSHGSTSSSYFSSYNSDSNRGPGNTPGLCGLSNLGNTCFMNSALQCMSNVPSLTQYFLSGDWENELNKDNPLGMNGEIATTYAEMIKNLWSGRISYFVPRNFKVAVGRFAPQFSGYAQQDSQELMAFLLDGLHEDLNRVKKKPYIEVKDADGRPDEEVAKESWENYLKRNDSVIVDTFHGLLKSRLICPECNKVSVTFDPFCYLSLPFPIRTERQIEVYLVPLDASKKPTQYKLTVSKVGTVFDLCKAMSKISGQPPEKMVVTDVYNHRFHKVFLPDEGLNHILERDDIYIYEIPVSFTGENEEIQIVPVYLRERKIKQQYQTYTSTQLFGQPLLVAVPRKNCTYDILYDNVLDRMSRYVTKPAEGEEWWRPKENGVEEEMKEDEEGSDTEAEKQQPGSRETTPDSGDGPEESLDPPPTKRLFTFHFVNSYGSTEVDAIKDDGKHIKFTNRSYIAIDWSAQAKSQFYDEKAAENVDRDESMDHRINYKNKTTQLSECLELFTKDEKLGEQDPWYCPACKKHQRALKKFDLWQLPRVLVVHLKRFQFTRYWREKLDNFIEYPTRGLNMRKYIINKDHGPATYDLLAVSNHYGGMGGGHYTAYGKNKETGQWYNFDDSSVSQTSEDQVTAKSGYVLIYQRREPGAGQGPYNHVPAAAAAAGTPDSDTMLSNGEMSCDEAMEVN